METSGRPNLNIEAGAGSSFIFNITNVISGGAEMESQEKVRMLQTVYAAALADAVLRFGREGILEKVTQQKEGEQMASGKLKAAQLDIATKEDVFLKLSDLMGCAQWKLEPLKDGDGFTAVTSGCMLCTMAKRMGAQSPCRIYCLDPMKGMVMGLDGEASFDVESTLFDDGECRIAISGHR